MNVKTIYKKFLKWQRREYATRGELLITFAILLAALVVLLING